MPKKRKTKQEKIILQLKRELAKEKKKKAASSSKKETRQGAISSRHAQAPVKKTKEKKPDKSIFFYNPRLVRQDLIKSLLLTLAVLSLEIVLYLKLS
jgi:hypothetical protein